MFTPSYYYKTDNTFSPTKFANQLSKLLTVEKKPLLVLCIGSDRITGDCLGPLTGYKLSALHLPNCKILGTLDQPVHAMNLAKTQQLIYTHYPQHAVLAIDAALGSPRHVNCISLHQRPLYPGLGVEKEFPPIGDCSITGIVSSETSFPYFTLQQVKLAHVMHMADCICEGILQYIQFQENTLHFFQNPLN